MKKEIQTPIGTRIRGLKPSEHVDLPQQKIGAINSAINYLRLSMNRSFSRNRIEGEVIRVTRIN